MQRARRDGERWEGWYHAGATLVRAQERETGNPGSSAFAQGLQFGLQFAPVQLSSPGFEHPAWPVA
jgi:hypothetical protein